MHYAM